METPARIAILPAPALGDGLLAMALAHNLHRQGRPVTVYHSQVAALGDWFPWARLRPLPSAVDERAALVAAGPAFVGDAALLDGRPGASGPATLVFTKGHWDRSRPYLRSLQAAAERALDVDWQDDDTGLRSPAAGETATPSRRLVLHPYSARRTKDWPERRWVELAVRLQRGGWAPEVLLAPDEEARWRATVGEACAVAVPGPLDAVASWLRGSRGAVAGDSGVAHLASALGLPVVSIFRKRSAARFWAPCWAPCEVVTAPWRLPGGGGHRHWGRLLSARRVAAAARRLFGAPAGI